MKINLSSLVSFKPNYDCSNNKRSYNNYPNLAPLKADTVSFGVKKDDFDEFDLFIQKKFSVAYTSFKTNKEFQDCCQLELERYYNKDYSARKEQATQDRKQRLNTWFNYLKTGNDAYTNSMKLIIIDGITKDLKSNNDKLPPRFDAGVLADTMVQIQNKVKNGQINNINFLNMYNRNLNKADETASVSDNEEAKGGTRWVVIPSEANDPENFEKNVERLQTLSCKSWCTKSYNARPYLSQGDFHIYLENGKPKVGVRFEGDKVVEIRGEKNNSKIPVAYLDIIKSHIEGCKTSTSVDIQIEVAENSQEVIKNIENLGKPLNEATPEELFTIFDMLEKVDDDGMLILKKYGQPDKEFDYITGEGDFSWDNLGIDETKLLKHVKEIKGNANFRHSKAVSLGNIEHIGRNFVAYGSQIQDLGKLEKIDGNADFAGAKFKNLGKLKNIGGTANFTYDCSITDLTPLKYIGGDAHFLTKNLTTLGSLETIGGNVTFRNSGITDLGNLKTVKGNVYLGQSKLSIENFNKVEVGGIISMQEMDSRERALRNLLFLGNNMLIRNMLMPMHFQN